MATFGERVRELRKAKRMTQADLAGYVSVTKYTVSIWERNLRRPEFTTLEQLCDLFQVRLSYLLGDSDDASAPIAPDDKMLEESMAESEIESQRSILRMYTRLGTSSRGIITAAITAAYHQERENGTLQLGYSIELIPIEETTTEAKDSEPCQFDAESS